MQKLLAISGGVDSVCLLHMYKDDPEVVVAHFNHGTRPSCSDDEEFVCRLAKEYGKKIIVGHANLGEGVSEEKARKARYDFLFATAANNSCSSIYTAHHLDDLIETIAINLLRGTGWRGLVPLDSPGIIRPFIELSLTKNDLLRYAANFGLSFREDPTNSENTYLRNRLRSSIKNLPIKTKHELIDLYHKQKEVKIQLEQILKALIPPDHNYKRSWFENLEENIALELLRAATKSQNISMTRPKLQDFLNAIKTYSPEKLFNLPGDKLVKIHKTHFVL